MAERRPEPRASLVDSGWSEPPTQRVEPKSPENPTPEAAAEPAVPSISVVPQSDKFDEDTRVDPPRDAGPTPDLPPPPPLPWQKPTPARELPKYEDSPRDLQETRVDDQMQARAQAMNADPHGERTVVATAQQSEHEIVTVEEPIPPPPPLPVPVPVPAVAARPPIVARPVVATHSAVSIDPIRPPVIERPFRAPVAEDAIRPPVVAPPPVAAPQPAFPPFPPAPPPEPVTQVDLVPPVRPPTPQPEARRDGPVLAAIQATGAAVPPWPNPIPAADDAPDAAPLIDALLGRVRLAGRSLPLWLVVAAVLLGTALSAALLAFAIGGSTGARSGTALPSPTGIDAVDKTAAPEAPSSEPERADGPEARAAAGDKSALAALEKKPLAELSSEEAVALFRGKAAEQTLAARALRARLAADPGLAKDSKVVSELLKLAHARDAASEALAAMAALPGPLSADLLYEVWTGTPERTDATELARALVLGKDVRPKASPALAVALDLREAESCEANKAALEKAVEAGDKRALAPITRLSRRTGCGANKRQDCFPCLREDDLVKRAFTAVRQRREPTILPK